jgi:hypothetical protein
MADGSPSVSSKFQSFTPFDYLIYAQAVCGISQPYRARSRHEAEYDLDFVPLERLFESRVEE